MVMMKTNELEGLAINYAVAKAEGWEPYLDRGKFPMYGDEDSRDGRRDFVPSTCWEQGGPIIEREEIQLRKVGITNWCAKIDLDEGDMMVQENTGHTLLIAAMRCYVASVLGNEVEISEVLL